MIVKKKTIDTFKEYGKKFIQALLGWMLVLLLGIIADLEYHGYINVLQLCPALVAIINFFRNCGFHYSNALTLLKGSFGILITAINLIFTLSVNIMDRSDKLIYGFSHRELNYWQENKVYHHMKRMTYFAPVLLVIAIILNWCITGYIILVFGYLFLLYNHMLYAGSYGRQKEREAVIDYLLHSVEKDMQGVNNLAEYKELLEYMRRSIEKEGNWRDTAQLYKELKVKASELPNAIDIVLLYYFFEIVYTANSSSREDIPMQQIKAQIKEVEGTDYVIEKEFVVLWGMWNAVFKKFSEENIIQFINWFSKGALRSYDMELSKGHNIEDDVWRSETGLFLIYIEYWLQFDNTSKIGINVENVRKIWGLGKGFLKKQNNTLVEECFKAYADYFDEDTDKLRECYNTLQKDILFDGNLSLVRNLLG